MWSFRARCCYDGVYQFKLLFFFCFDFIYNLLKWRCSFPNVFVMLLYLRLIYFTLFFLSVFFFHEHLQITGLQGEGGGILVTPHYHFHPLHRNLDISRWITAESSLWSEAGKILDGKEGFKVKCLFVSFKKWRAVIVDTTYITLIRPLVNPANKYILKSRVKTLEKGVKYKETRTMSMMSFWCLYC